MLTVPEALAVISGRAKRLPAGVEPLTSAALGQVLAEDITADIDSPPFDKSLMDGFAVRSADCDGPATLQVVAEVAAGGVAETPVAAWQAARVATGAMLPEGADAVVRSEDAVAENDTVSLRDPVAAGANVLRRGAEMAAGSAVLRAGTALRPQEFGLLAAVGRTSVPMYPAPSVAILATGDELIEAARRPKPGQIRNANGPMLVMQAVRAGGLPRYLGIARDDPKLLRSLIGEGLTQCQILVLSGGVSAGRRDFVPGVLAEMGVEAHFHKVAVKPGKPLLFGSRGDTLVFGLPGNPVSSFVGFELFVRPAIGLMRGQPEPHLPRTELPLVVDFAYTTDRPTYYPAALDGPGVRPLPWLGSADLCGFSRADALLELRAGGSQFQEGETAKVLRIPL